MSKRPPFGRIVWRGISKGRSVLRARCPHCAGEHQFTKAPVAECPRTGLRLSLRLHAGGRKS